MVYSDEFQSTVKPCSPLLKGQQKWKKQKTHEGRNTSSVIAFHNCIAHKLALCLGAPLPGLKKKKKKSHSTGDILLS